MKMAGESNPCNFPIRILLVDDDAISLSIVSGQLKRCHHQVLSMKNPLDALSTLRVKHESFDLIFTDVHMPEMNGIQLQKIVMEEFGLPVVLMSGDNEKEMMLQGLENGASFYFVKPISPEHLDKLWQYTYLSKRETPYPSTRSPRELGFENLVLLDDHDVEMGGSLMANKEKHVRSPSKRKLVVRKDDGAGKKKGTGTSKKPKVVWTTLLHNQFLEAVNKIGLDKAVPKKILEMMNVRGLRRENVASHLQKYRIFLRRLSEANKPMQNGLPKGLIDRPLRSSFALGHLTYGLNNLGWGSISQGAVPVDGINHPSLTSNITTNIQLQTTNTTEPHGDADIFYKGGKRGSRKRTHAPGKNKRNSGSGTSKVTKTNDFCARSNYVGLQIIANGDYDERTDNVNLLQRGSLDYVSSSSARGIQNDTFLQSDYMEKGSVSFSNTHGLTSMLTFGGNISFGHVPS